MVFMYLEVSTGVAIAAQTKELQNSLVLKKDEFWDELRKLVLIIARLCQFSFCTLARLSHWA